MSISNRYCFKNPELFKIEELFEKHLVNYKKTFILFFVKCEWELQFTDTIIRVKSKEMNILLFPCGFGK